MTVSTAGWCGVEMIRYNAENGRLEMSEGGRHNDQHGQLEGSEDGRHSGQHRRLE